MAARAQGTATREVASGVPARVAKLFGSGGRPLAAAERLPFESEFRHSFADVRVQDDTPAAEAAEEIGAAAFTVGRKIAFGRRRLDARSPDGLALLRHELAHVVQQSGAMPVAPRRIGPAGDAAERDARTHAMPRPRNVPPGTVQRQALLGGPRLELRPHLLPEDVQRIDGYLSLHGFGLAGVRPVLDGQVMTIDEIVERVRPLVLPIIPRSDIERMISARHEVLVFRAMHSSRLRVSVPRDSVPTPHLLSPPPAATGSASQSPTAPQLAVAAAANFGWHLSLIGGVPATPASDVAMQFQVGMSTPHHAEGASGREDLRFIQFNYNVTTGAIQITAGLQETYVLSLFHGVLQLAVFAQALAGLATGAPTATGWGNVAQASAGAQLMIQLGPVQFGGLVGGSVTLATGQPPTIDLGLTPGAQGNLPGTATQGFVGFTVPF